MREAIVDLLLETVGAPMDAAKRLDELESLLAQCAERQRTLIDYAPEAVVILDVELGCFIDCNGKAEELLGLPRDELLRVGPFATSPALQPDGQSSSELGKAKIEEALAGGAPVFQWWHRNARGSHFPCEVRLVRMPWGGRDVLRGSIVNTSDRKYLEICDAGRSVVLHGLARNKETSAIMAELISTMECSWPGMICSVLLLDSETNCLRHCAAPSLPEFYCQAVDGLEIGPSVGSCGTAAFTAQRVVVADIQQSPLWANYLEIAERTQIGACWSQPIFSFAGAILGTFAIYYRQPREPLPVELRIVEFAAEMAAVTCEQEQMQQRLVELNASLEQRVEQRTSELEAANRELERSNDELQQFAYVASHDLQEPIRMVASFGQMLQRKYSDQLEPRAAEWIQFIVEGAGRMQALVNDLLNYSRIDTQSRPFRPVNLHRVTKEVLANLGPSIDDTRATVEIAALPTVMADRPQLIQLFQNLLSNAIKFNDGQPPRVEVSASERDDAWQICIRDHGIGIERRHHRNVFEFFKRLHGRDKYPGTGIGLAVCRRVVERHGGQIWVESQPGQGSAFFFSLPKREPS